MKRIRITGEATVRFVTYIEVPDDEVRELLDDDENLKTNVDEDGGERQVISWDFIRGEVMP